MVVVAVVAVAVPGSAQRRRSYQPVRPAVGGGVYGSGVWCFVVVECGGGVCMCVWRACVCVVVVVHVHEGMG